MFRSNSKTRSRLQKDSSTRYSAINPLVRRDFKNRSFLIRLYGLIVLLAVALGLLGVTIWLHKRLPDGQNSEFKLPFTKRNVEPHAPRPKRRAEVYEPENLPTPTVHRLVDIQVRQLSENPLAVLADRQPLNPWVIPALTFPATAPLPTFNFADPELFTASKNATGDPLPPLSDAPVPCLGGSSVCPTITVPAATTDYPCPSPACVAVGTATSVNDGVVIVEPMVSCDCPTPTLPETTVVLTTSPPQTAGGLSCPTPVCLPLGELGSPFFPIDIEEEEEEVPEILRRGVVARQSFCFCPVTPVASSSITVTSSVDPCPSGMTSSCGAGACVCVSTSVSTTSSSTTSIFTTSTTSTSSTSTSSTSSTTTSSTTSTSSSSTSASTSSTTSSTSSDTSSTSETTSITPTTESSTSASSSSTQITECASGETLICNRARQCFCRVTSTSESSSTSVSSTSSSTITTSTNSAESSISSSSSSSTSEPTSEDTPTPVSSFVSVFIDTATSVSESLTEVNSAPVTIESSSESISASVEPTESVIETEDVSEPLSVFVQSQSATDSDSPTVAVVTPTDSTPLSSTVAQPTVATPTPTSVSSESSTSATASSEDTTTSAETSAATKEKVEKTTTTKDIPTATGGGGGGGGDQSPPTPPEDAKEVIVVSWPATRSVLANHAPLIVARAFVSFLAGAHYEISVFEPGRQLFSVDGASGPALAGSAGTLIPIILSGFLADIGSGFAAESVFLDTNYCDVPVLQGSLNPCWPPRVSTNRWALTVLTTTLAVVSVGLTYVVALWIRTPQTVTMESTTSIAAVASVMGHPVVDRDFSTVPAELTSEGLGQHLKDKRYTMGTFSVEEMGTRYGIMPLVLSPENRGKRSTLERVESSMANLKAGTSSSDWVKRRQYADAAFAILFLALLGLCIAAVVHVDDPRRVFRYNTRGWTIGVRIGFSILAIMIARYWTAAFADVQHFCHFARLHSGASEARDTINKKGYALPIVAILPLARMGYVVPAAVAITALISESFVIALAGLPYRPGQLRGEYIFCGIASIAMLAVMLVMIWFLYRWRKTLPHMPRRPDSVAAVMTYVAETTMARDLAEMEQRKRKERRRAIEGLGKRYGYGFRVEPDGRKRWVVDEVEVEYEAERRRMWSEAERRS